MKSKKPMPFKGKAPFFGKESKAEERAEKKMPPGAYKRMEKAEGVHGMKKGGSVKGKRGC